MAAWLCADEAQQSKLVSSMDEYNSYADVRAEALVAKKLLAEMHPEHEVVLAGCMDDTKEE